MFRAYVHLVDNEYGLFANIPVTRERPLRPKPSPPKRLNIPLLAPKPNPVNRLPNKPPPPLPLLPTPPPPNEKYLFTSCVPTKNTPTRIRIKFRNFSR